MPTRAARSVTSQDSGRPGATGSPPGPATPPSRSIFVSYASVFWPSLATNNALAFALGLSVIWVLTLVNMAGVRESGVIQVVTTVLKFVPLLLIGVIGLFYMNSGNFSPFDPNHVSLVGHWHAISFAATLTLWAFLGLESATVPAEEIKDVKRTLPRATIYRHASSRPRST